MSVALWLAIIASTLCLVAIARSYFWLGTAAVAWWLHTWNYLHPLTGFRLDYVPYQITQSAWILAFLVGLMLYVRVIERHRLLKAALAEMEERQQERIGSNEQYVTDVLEGKAHQNFLYQNINGASENIIIITGWVAIWVISRDLLKYVEERLEIGVVVYIGFGYEGKNGEHQSLDSGAGEKALLHLAKLYPDSLYIGKWACHEKQMIVDNEKVVFGSANWLANANYKNTDRSVVLIDKSLAISEAERAIKLIKQNIIEEITA
jgi:phosphatidylserine/phosphatidylglycerophosphate/cardiolipin synthase-like enzyme